MEEQMEGHTGRRWQVCSRPCKGGTGAVPTKGTLTDTTKDLHPDFGNESIFHLVSLFSTFTVLFSSL